MNDSTKKVEKILNRNFKNDTPTGYKNYSNTNNYGNFSKVSCPGSSFDTSSEKTLSAIEIKKAFFQK